MMTWQWTVLSDGWTEAHEAVAIQGGSWRRKVRFYATAVLLENEQHGAVLFDTGYSPRFRTETASWPYWLYGRLTPVTLTEPGGLVEILRRRGVAASSVKHVIISHWHADHIGGLRDFPDATLYSTRAGWESVQGLRGFAALRKAFLPSLVPEDAASRLSWLQQGGDVLGDGSLQVMELPGHATGQIGIRFLAEDGQPVLLAADACWLSRAYRENRMPHPVTALIQDLTTYRESLNRLHQIHRQEPDLLIVPAHCPETAAQIQPPPVE